MCHPGLTQFSRLRGLETLTQQTPHLDLLSSRKIRASNLLVLAGKKNLYNLDQWTTSSEESGYWVL